MAKMKEWIAPKMPALPEAPKPVRMPTEQDPSVLAAGERQRENAMRRKGRLSTIMTDTDYGSGTKLGA